MAIFKTCPIQIRHLQQLVSNSGWPDGSRPQHREREGRNRGKEKAATWSAPVCSGRNCPRPAPTRRSAVVRVRRRPQGRKRTPCAQTLTARTAWYVEGNSKSTPPLHCTIPGQAQRAGRERRDGRRREGSKPTGRDRQRLAWGIAREPDGAMRRHAKPHPVPLQISRRIDPMLPWRNVAKKP